MMYISDFRGKGGMRRMKSSDIICALCEKKQVSVSALAKMIGQTPQNFWKKIKRDTVTLDEMLQIAAVLQVTYEQVFVFPDGERISLHQIAKSDSISFNSGTSRKGLS